MIIFNFIEFIVYIWVNTYLYMFEYELPEYNDFHKLYNNLMSKEKADTNITTDSTKREDLITQMLMDNLGLELSKDSRFVKGRFIFYYDISYYKEKNQNPIIKNVKILKTSKEQDFNFQVNGIEYKIELNQKNSRVCRNKTEKETNNPNDDTLSLHTIKTNTSEKHNMSATQKNEKDTNFYTKKFKDTINNENYVLEITHTNHEVDGYLITKEDINIRDSLKQLLYYPIIEVESPETEVESLKNDEESKKEEKESESNHENVDSKVTEKKEPTGENYMPEKQNIKEKPENNDGHRVNILNESLKDEKLAKTVEDINDIEELTKIKKKSKILIEVKQNTTLVTLFDQIKTTINDLKIILPDEKFYYFGFVNEANAKSGLKERDFKENIKNFELHNPNYKIFLFIIKDNTFFDLPLDDKADYPTAYRNEIKKEIKEMKKEIKEMKNQFTSEIKEIKTDIEEIKNNIQDLMNFFHIKKEVSEKKESK